MSGNPNTLSQFWLELKRRKVVRVITVYAAAAFVILELADIVAPSLGLPDWTLNLIIILLCVGFIISVILSWIYDIHPEGGIIKTEPAQKVKAEKIPKSSNSWKIASYISFVVIISLLAFNIFRGNTSARIDESLEKSIAVLPFHNYSGDQDQNPMCLGLTDEIITNLYKIESFEKVISLTSVLTYKDSDKKTNDIAEELGVNYVLEGTYKKIGDQLRVTAQLIDSKSDKHIWSQDYELPYNEVIGIPAEIALQMANHLKAFISKDEKQSIDRMPTNNLEAYELMQEAIYLFNTVFINATDQIIGLAREVIRLDPNYADAYAMIGIFTLLKGTYFGGVDLSSIAWEAETFLEKAISLDERNVRAIAGLASIDHLLRWDYAKAEERFIKAMDFKPDESVLNLWSVLLWIQMNRLNYALELLEKADFEWIEARAKVHFLSGNRQKAYDLIPVISMSKLEFMYASTSVAELYIWLKEYSSAIEVCESAIQSSDPCVLQPRFQASLAVAYHETGAVAQARILIDRLIRKSETSSAGSPEYFLGTYYSWIGEPDSAFHWLEKACENRSPEMPWLKMDPAFNTLKDDPRYRDLYERTGHKAYDEYLVNMKDH